MLATVCHALAPFSQAVHPALKEPLLQVHFHKEPNTMLCLLPPGVESVLLLPCGAIPPIEWTMLIPIPREGRTREGELLVDLHVAVASSFSEPFLKLRSG